MTVFRRDPVSGRKPGPAGLRSRVRGESPHAGARAVTALVFAAQGAAVAAVSTTVPAVKERFGLAPLVTTAVILVVALSAGAGSFLGLAAVRRWGPVAGMRGCVVVAAAALLCIAQAPSLPPLVASYVLFGLGIGGIDVSANTRAADIERHYGHSIFASFYAVWSCAGVAGALVTAGTSRLGWPVEDTLTVQAACVAALALGIRSHRLPGAVDTVTGHAPGRPVSEPVSAASGTPAVSAAPAASAAPTASAGLAVSAGPNAGIWARLVPFGLVLLVAYVIDSAVSTWSTAYLHQSLAASLAAAPLAYAAYQAGTVAGRSGGDRLVRRIGPAAVVRWAAVVTAVALAALACAPGWPAAVAAAGLTGVGVSAFAPLCLASAGRLRPEAAEAILARLNLFNYFGVIAGGAASGVLGSAGHFRLAYAVPVVPALLLMTAARFFSTATDRDPRPSSRPHRSASGPAVAPWPPR